MISGIGFQEILLVGVAILVFFGPKGVSGIMRDLGKFVGSLKKYRDDFTRELMAISEPVVDEEEIRKKERTRIRTASLQTMKDLPEALREKENAAIQKKLKTLAEFKKAKRVFCYLSVKAEVDTLAIVRDLLKKGVEVLVPYCKTETFELGVGRLTDIRTDLKPGAYGVPEPKAEQRDPALESEIADLYLVPGLAFDNDLTRLGRGKGYFDRFLKDIKGKAPIWGLSFDEQIYPYSIPKYDHDISPDLVITPNETIRPKKEDADKPA